MRAFSRIVAKELARRLAQREATRNLLWLAPLIPVAAILLAVGVVTLIVFVVVAGQGSGGCGTSVPVGTPAAKIKAAAQVVQYFESQGISQDGAAGIVGNLEQESGLVPTTPGGGLAQWLGSRWTAMVAYVSSRGLDPNSLAGQLTYIVYDLRTKYTTLLAELNSASDPSIAATMFETVYEVCSGVVGYLQVVPGSACNDPARRANAVAALGGSGGNSMAIPVSLPTSGTCVVGGSQSALAMLSAAVFAAQARVSYSNAVNASGPLAGWRSDCSGFASWVLFKGGFNVGDQTTVTFPATPGILPGPGAQVTLWNRPLPGQSGHVVIDILGRWFESGGALGVGVAEMTPPEVLGELGIASASALSSGTTTSRGFSPLHPNGL